MSAPAPVLTRDALAAARAMARLNAHVKSDDRLRDQVYRLKTRLTRALYMAGYCTGAMPEGRRGTETLRFGFDIAGERFQWHQRARAVDWDVALGSVDHRGTWEPRARLNASEFRLAVRAVWAYLDRVE